MDKIDSNHKKKYWIVSTLNIVCTSFTQAQRIGYWHKHKSQFKARLPVWVFKSVIIGVVLMVLADTDEQTGSDTGISVHCNNQQSL